ncbi:hypothetical protein [Robertmurraya sp. FSL R5-0851]|uniref:hypothetical protein n=1 Tax=Robertmurraya sp. FSL R5-0851 TaxID=2921584 RepID=UPI0030FBB8B6
MMNKKAGGNTLANPSMKILTVTWIVKKAIIKVNNIMFRRWIISLPIIDVIPVLG